MHFNVLYCFASVYIQIAKMLCLLIILMQTNVDGSQARGNEFFNYMHEFDCCVDVFLYQDVFGQIVNFIHGM